MTKFQKRAIIKVQKTKGIEIKMIYWGYQGSGKSTYCRNNPNTTVDLDSSAFVKVAGWEENYVRTAVALAGNKNVFISAHRVVIEYCMKNSIPFVVLAPSQSKEAWRSRLEFRYHKTPSSQTLKQLQTSNKTSTAICNTTDSWKARVFACGGLKPQL